ncbi:MAG: hypothetical protein IPK27_08340 [Rhodanobacteraceae bacterium]|nr:hypothetical protein [Rhodanobacteraceae bacterium]
MVLDTNRRPPVLAARDGKCPGGVTDRGVSTHFDQITGMHGLTVFRAGGLLGVQSGLYRYGLMAARLLLPTSAFPNSWGFTSVGLFDAPHCRGRRPIGRRIKLVAVDVDSGSIFCSHRQSLAMVQRNTLAVSWMGSLIFEAEPSGVWSDGHPARDKGHAGAPVSPDFQKAYTFGTDRVPVSSHSGVHLVGPAGGTLIDRIPRLDDEIWKAARFSYSRADRASYRVAGCAVPSAPNRCADIAHR